MENTNKPMVTITADEYFDLRSKAEANAYVAQNIEGFRGNIDELNHAIWKLEERVNKLENK